jgi:hypothetical protein
MRANRGSRRALVCAVIGLIVAMLAPVAGRAGVYVGGATVVYKQAGQDPEVDRGVVVCNVETGAGIGGGCLPFSPANQFIEVLDVLQTLDPAGNNGHNVAFQVCIDVDGDNRCVSGGDPQPTTPCPDIVFFSHNDAGMFFNPLGPLPQTWPIGCPVPNTGRNWIGYVVFLCEGAHVADAHTGIPHTHPTTAGTIKGTTNGPYSGGFGDFCGGLKDQIIKDYVVE